MCRRTLLGWAAAGRGCLRAPGLQAPTGTDRAPCVPLPADDTYAVKRIMRRKKRGKAHSKHRSVALRMQSSVPGDAGAILALPAKRAPHCAAHSGNALTLMTLHLTVHKCLQHEP